MFWSFELKLVVFDSMQTTITQKELARRLQISQQAVSMALSGDDRISLETRDKVCELARRHGYRPNLAARTIRSGRFGNIILVPGNLPGDQSLDPLFLDALHDKLVDHDLHISYVRIPDAELTKPRSLPRLLREMAGDGLIIHYSMDAPPALKELVEKTPQPVVWVSGKLTHDCVYPDDVAAGRMAAEHLVTLGHRRIAYFFPYEGSMNEPWMHHVHMDRYEGYAQAMEQAGLEPVFWKEHWQGSVRRENWGRNTEKAYRLSRREAAMALLQKNPRPTAIVCQKHLTLYLLHAADQMGIRIPDDLSILAFSNPKPVMFPMELTRVEPDFDRYAQAAVEMLTRKMSGQRKSCDPVLIAPVFHSGETTAPPAEK